MEIGTPTQWPTPHKSQDWPACGLELGTQSWSPMWVIENQLFGHHLLPQKDFNQELELRAVPGLRLRDSLWEAGVQRSYLTAVPSACSHKIILTHLHFDWTFHMVASVEFSTCGVMLALKFHVFKYFGVCILGLGMFSLYKKKDLNSKLLDYIISYG